MRIGIIVLLLTVVLSAQGAAPERDALRAAASLALGNDQPLTKAEHDLFWQYLSPLSEEEKIEFTRLIGEMQSDLIAFSLHTWECADQAWVKQQVVDCEKKEAIWKRLNNNLIQKHGASLERTAGIYENSTRIIQAAALRKPYRSMSGEDYDLSSRRVILETIFSFEGRTKRLSQALRRPFSD